MTVDYRMLSADGLPVAIRIDLLLDGRLKQYGVEAETKVRPPSEYVSLRGVDGCLQAQADVTRLCHEFYHNSCSPIPWSVVAAVEKEFDIEMLFEEDSSLLGIS
jgi:hypothetical protein